MISRRNMVWGAIALALFGAQVPAYGQEGGFHPISIPRADANDPNSDQVAFAGYDVVARFPGGVHSQQLGRIVLGDRTFALEYKSAVFWFASDANRQAFAKNPGWFMPPVGGYCLGALSRGRLTPGYLDNAFFVPELQTWAVYGSTNGPRAWRRMSPTERRLAFRAALESYYHWTKQ